MTRLTGLDGAFLAFESPTTHLHIIGALIFDPRDVPGGFDFERVRRLIAERVERVPPFRMRLAEVPFGLSHASMVEDTEFELGRHVRRACLPRPGDAQSLPHSSPRWRPDRSTVGIRCGSSRSSKAWRMNGAPL